MSDMILRDPKSGTDQLAWLRAFPQKHIPVKLVAGDMFDPRPEPEISLQYFYQERVREGLIAREKLRLGGDMVKGVFTADMPLNCLPAAANRNPQSISPCP